MLGQVKLPLGTTIVETEHPYKAQSHSWSRSVTVKGSKELSIHFGSKCRTYDSCANLGIKKEISTAAGVGARVQFKTLGEESSCEQMRGTVIEPSSGGLMKVRIDDEDLRHSSIYVKMVSQAVLQKSTTSGHLDEDSKGSLVMCAEEQKRVKVRYGKGVKVGDEISGFVVDKTFLASPFSVAGFSGPGPAQEDGVQSGWFLDLGSTLQTDYTLGQVFAEQPPDAEADTDARLEHMLKLLQGFLDLTDVTLIFVNGLEANVLPSAHAKYGKDTTVGDEIAAFEASEGYLIISAFKDKGPAQEAGVEVGWRLNLDKVVGQGLIGAKSGSQNVLGQFLNKAEAISTEKLIAEPEKLLSMSSVTLFFEPASLDQPDIFTGSGDSGWGGGEPVKVPSDTATFHFVTDGDGVDFVDRRWGIFAVVVPAGGETPSQEVIDDLGERWVQVTERATGFANGMSLEQEDWDEARLRALCKRHGWEFEWMTEDGERHRRMRAGEERAREVATSATARGGGGEATWWSFSGTAEALKSKVWNRNAAGATQAQADVVRQEHEDPTLAAVDVRGLKLAAGPTR